MANLTVKKSGNPIQMMSPEEAQIRSLKVYFSPHQEGSGDPSPENVRPITGYEGVKVQHCGKNLWGGEYAANEIKKSKPSQVTLDEDSNGKYVMLKYMSGAQAYFINNVKFKENTSYTIMFKAKSISDSGSTRLCMRLFYTDGTQVEFQLPTVSSEIQQFRFVTSANKTVKNIGDVTRGTEAYIYYNTLGIFEGNVSVDQFEPYKTRISRVPSEYQEVEYLESTGTQYIDLNFGFDPTDEVETRFSINIEQKIDKYIVSPSNWNTDNNRFSMGVHGGTATLNAGYYTVGYGASSTSTTKFSPDTLNDGGFHDWEYKDYVFSIPDVNRSKNVSPITFGSTTANLRLFYGYKSNTKGKISSYHHKKADTTEINLIPCYRISDSTPGMWDTVSKTFYTNSGTGEFIVGPAVNKYDVDWSGDVGTVYGGYVDLISGELVETHYGELLTEVNSEKINEQYNTSQTVFFRCDHKYNHERGGKYGIVDLKCDILNPVGINWGAGDTQDKYVNTITERYNSYKAVCMRMYNSVFGIEHGVDDIDVKKQKINEWLAQNPIKISYKLPTPITHTLSQSSLTTFLNSNTLWANADKIEIEYDLVETDEIQQIRRKILLNTPHLETASGSVAQFNTDVRTKLKDGRIYFSPVQEGEGTPSPENVRPISGWDGITIYKNIGADLYDYDVVGATSSTIVTKINENSFNLTTSSKKIYPASRQYTSTLELISGRQYIVDFDILIETMSEGHRCSFGFRNKSNAFQADASAVIYSSGHYNFTFTFDNETRLYYLSLCETSGELVSFSATISNLTIYEVEELTITFPQTIYGGYVDLKNGEVVETDVKTTFGTTGWNQQAHNVFSKIISNRKPTLVNEDSNIVSNMYDTHQTRPITQLDSIPDLTICGRSTYSTVFVRDTRFSTVGDFTAAMGNTEFTYELVTPIHHSLTIPEILTLRGTNSIWSNGNGNLQVTYWTH